jgi:hypothetical protein
MKHPTRYVSRRVREVTRGRQALDRQASAAVRKIREDPKFQELLTELTRYLVELAIRIVIFSVVNRCLRPRRPHSRVVSFRPKPVS